jgi:hypothetical protein
LIGIRTCPSELLTWQLVSHVMELYSIHKASSQLSFSPMVLQNPASFSQSICKACRHDLLGLCRDKWAIIYIAPTRTYVRADQPLHLGQPNLCITIFGGQLRSFQAAKSQLKDQLQVSAT